MTDTDFSPASKRSGKPLQEYDAHCHCGAVRIKFQHGPLEDEEIISCNCSICIRNGYVLIYPLAKDITIVKGESDLSNYYFGSKQKPHRFCKHCSSSMLIDFSVSGDKRLEHLMAINARMVNGIEDRIDSLKMLKTDGKNLIKPAYAVPDQ